MNKICISSRVNNAWDPISTNYVNIYRWPESAADRGGAPPCGRAEDGILCRKVYLRSYKFSRERVAAAGRRTEEMKALLRRRRRRRRKGMRRRVVVIRRVKRFSCAALRAFFRRLLLCAASVDVVDQSI
ncbi:N-acetyl-l-glutamate synthase 2 [Striga asiatica]|uniref:N-acetyl-l-glutamate synthase 2 n=1 Tax=Striga asiatica TaxID=4170 RepID=A0A5A7QDY0_STRAF|nr:N-acetyl-l-glutamate synthase 2 [Striga asiatica]